MRRAFAVLLACGTLLAGMPRCANAEDSPSSALHVTPSEQRFFQCGYQLGKAAFAYADLVKHATEISQSRNDLTQLPQLAGLSPRATRDRMTARDGFTQAATLMQAMGAPDAALAPVQRAAAHLAKPLAFSGDAAAIAQFNHRAAQTLASLDEFNLLSSIPEDAAVRRWIAAAPSGQVWYAEGLIAALAETASAQQMPELLPPVKEIATDLRGLRDWLSLRLPDQPTPDQTAFQAALDGFLQETARTGRPQTTPLTLAQLQSLGDISRRLQTLILGDTPPAPVRQTLR